MEKHNDLRKAFTEEVVKAVEAIARRYGLDEVVSSHHEPMVLAARGCLRREGTTGEQVEIAVLLSGDIRQAEAVTSLSQAVNQQVQVVNPTQIYRSFDISESVASDAAGAGDEITPTNPCDHDHPVIK